jgi:stress-induced morphogen
MSRAETLRHTLEVGLAPAHLEVIDESSQHSVPRGAETHFKVLIVSEAFAGLPLVQRHRRVNQLLGEAFRAGLHALSIHAKTPAEWAASPEAMASPACLGGSKAEGKAG